MSQPDLTQRSTALAQALHGLERSLQETRSQWDDAARQTFDRRHADALVQEGRRLVQELCESAQELTSATRILAQLGQ
jgi:hypothetical protein